MSTASTAATTAPGEPNRADWVPRDDMALLTRTSVDTVRRDVKKHGLKTRDDAAGRVLVNVGDFITIGRLRDQDLTVGASPAESAAVIRSRELVAELRAQLARAQGRLDQAEPVVATLREQLASKDKQLAKRDDHVAQLTTLLGQLSLQRRSHDIAGGAR